MDSGVGDLIIWRTILQAARERNRDVPFVTKDQENDWSVRTGGHGIYPRPELVEEFRRETNNRSFHIATLASFLRLVKAQPEVIKEVEQVEEVEQIQKIEQVEHTDQEMLVERAYYRLPLIGLNVSGHGMRSAWSA